MLIIFAITFILLILIYFNLIKKDYYYSVIAYILFFIGPMLTYIGEIGVLTGFNKIQSYNNYMFGITFYTVYVAHQIYKNKEHIERKKLGFLLVALNPIYLFTGPFPISSFFNVKIFKYKRFPKIWGILILDKWQ